MKPVALALIGRDERWFLQRRDPANPVLPGLWEFPGGKLEAGETPEAALERELREEVGLQLLAAWPCPVPGGPAHLHPFQVAVAGKPATDLAWGWFTFAEMLSLPIPPLNRILIGHWLREPPGPEPRSGPPHLVG
jgi:ADP-ribose pyrophosphatase YjhB (NUDIX family)